jgi:hypothetical protein
MIAKFNSNKMRSASGSNVIELASTSLIMAVMTVMCIDVGTVVFGTITHNRACQQACRAAAQGNDSTRAISLARAVLKASATDGYFLSNPTFTDNELVYNDYNGQPTPTEVPTVTLTTHADIRLPAGASFAGALLGAPDGVIHSACNYTYPIMNFQQKVPEGGGAP